MYLVLARYDTLDEPLKLFKDHEDAERFAKSKTVASLSGKKDSEGNRPKRPVNVSIVGFDSDGSPQATEVVKWFE